MTPTRTHSIHVRCSLPAIDIALILSSDDFDADYSGRTTVVLTNNHPFDLDPSLFGDEAEHLSRGLRRQPSSDSPLSNLSLKLGGHFPSLTRRWRSRKDRAAPAGLGIQTSNISRPHSTSRSSSLTSANFSGFDQNDVLPVTPAISSRADSSTPVSPVEISRPNNDEPIDRQALASTPLLPPTMNAARKEEEDHMQSPLQSPTIADPNKTFSIVSSPAETPQLQSIPSPSLSTKPSVSSFSRSRTSTLPNCTEAPPLLLAEPSDEWSIKLGHANFVIAPEPYLPVIYEAQSCRQLVTDWELARSNYFKHRHRTIEHYGANSKIFRLTEEKWKETEAYWRKNNDLATAQAAITSSDAIPIIPTEPAPLNNMPTLNDPRSEGKFPKLGDQDIVGPMVQIAPPALQQPEASTGKVATFFRGVFGRSRSASLDR